jgi:acyl-CoA reductase-like NAD-dependent aldehyde dehydrogenase
MQRDDVTAVQPLETALTEHFKRLHLASRATLMPTAAERRELLSALIALLHDNRPAIAKAIAADFGHRSAQETDLLEIFPALEAARHARRHVARWMRPQSVSPSIWFRPGRARVVWQPLGLVGIVVPWNYPVLLAASPMASALAAGNRVMVKMSELTAGTGALFAHLCERYLPSDWVQVVNGDVGTAERFVNLDFDHLLFTGSTAIGRRVMRAAAEHLTPVTLELGGKSPAIVGPHYPIATAAERILHGKCINAGQTCIAPDYVLVPQDRRDEFIACARAAVADLYPELGRTPDYTQIINDRHYGRLQDYLEEAREAGATLHALNPGRHDFTGTRILPPTLLIDVPPHCAVMQEEIFGPLLPVVGYHTLDDALAYVNARPRPLALYYFDHNRARIDRVLNETIAGGVTINDTILHIAQDNLPFGGVGPSGMGHYHGHDGFATFSKKKPVFLQSHINGLGLFKPPYGGRFEALIKILLR